MRHKWAMSATITSVVLLLVVVVLARLLIRQSRASAGPPELLVGDTAPAHKQLWTCGMHPQVIQDHPGICPICHMKLVPLNIDSGGSSPEGKPKIAYWWDPMLGPSSISNHPGKSAMGMDLVPVYESKVSGGPGVRIDPAVVQNMGVLTAPVERGPVHVTIRAVGMLEVPQPAMTDVTLRVSGFIEKLYADTEGMPVASGQVLFDLYSPDLQVAEQELIGAAQGLKALDPSASPSVKQEAQELVDSARRKLELWGVAKQDIDAIAASNHPLRTVPFRSPADGHIEDKSIVEGSAVQSGQRLMRIEDHRKLWLDAEVYEDQIESVAVGQIVHATIDGVPGKTFDGTVSFIYPHLNHMTRTELVRTVLDNPEHQLRPGMYATAEIVTQPVADAILAPREAVIDTGAQQIAFVFDPTQRGHFEPRDVRVGQSGDNDQIQIIQGLAPGEQVVTSGQFLMDVESRTTEAIQKLRNANANTAAMAGSAAVQPPPMQMPAASTMPSASTIKSPPTMAQTTTVPATTAPIDLVIAHCPMKNADWLQIGDAINNPFFGTAMPSCGSVVRKIAPPAAGSPFAAVVSAYLRVAAALDADHLDIAAIHSLLAASQALPGDDSSKLQSATQHLAAATTIDTARGAFAEVGAALIPLLPAHR